MTDDGLVEITGQERDPVARPQIITDSMDAVRHPVTGQYMDSKSEFRKITRAAGCEEMGNEQPRDRRDWSIPSGLGQDIKRVLGE